MKLAAVPVKIAEACEFVRNFHRHNAPPLSGLFAVGASDGGTPHGRGHRRPSGGAEPGRW
jgi:hypothetical protein